MLFRSPTANESKTFEVNHDTLAQSQTIYYNPKTETVSETTKVPVTVHYVYGSGPKKGQPAAPDVTEEKTFTRTGVKNDVTGEVTWNSWTPTQTVNPVKSPDVPGYVPTANESKTFEVNHDTPAQSQTIYYNPKTETVTETTKVPVTVHYVYGSGPKKGQPAAPGVTEEKTFTRTGVKNDVTGKVTWGNWTPTQTVNPVKSPDVPGYVPTENESKTFEVSHDTPAQSQTIYYNPETKAVVTLKKPASPKKVSAQSEKSVSSKKEAVKKAAPSEKQNTVKHVSEISVKPEQRKVVAKKEAKKNTLPQMGDGNSKVNVWGEISLAVAGILAALGFSEKKRHE